MVQTRKPNKNTVIVPKVIGLKVLELEPLVRKWMHQNRQVPLSMLARRGFKLALKPYAGKRYAHLVQE